MTIFRVPASQGALLSRIVDYAGLFPPGNNSMVEAVRLYATHRNSAERWMLGRFVLPAVRLDEFIVAGSPYLRTARGQAVWPLSVLVGPDSENDIARVVRFNEISEGARIEAVEARAASVAGVRGLASALPRGLHAFVEVPLHGDPDHLVEAIGAVGLRAKARTGGVSSDLIPSVGSVARFVEACVRHRVAFKFTAGLHHAVRAVYPLTYDEDSPRSTMFGFLNVFVASLLAYQGESGDVVEQVLREGARDAFHFDDDALRWRDHSIATSVIERARATSATSFGSCSFSEPVEELSLTGRALVA